VRKRRYSPYVHETDKKETALNKNRRHQEEKMTYGRKGKRFQLLNDTLMYLSGHESKFMLIAFLLVAFRR
jgi:hypothetical protein